MSDETAEQFFHRFAHDINCLSDQDRAVRKQGLEKIKKELFTTSNKEHIHQLLSQSLMSPLLKCIEDPIEKHRDIAIQIFETILRDLHIENKMLLKMLILSVVARMDKLPFLESSEEIRLKLVKLLDAVLAKYPDEFSPVMSELSKMLSVLLRDQFPDIKQNLSKFISTISQKLKKEIGAHSKTILDSLCLNLKHQHNKVRKITITAVVDLLLTENAGLCIDDCIPSLTLISNDKNADVRKTFVNEIAKLIKGLNIVYLKSSEAQLVCLLMSGINDDKEEIRKLSFELIEDVGKNRMLLGKETGENIDELYSKFAEGMKS